MRPTLIDGKLSKQSAQTAKFSDHRDYQPQEIAPFDVTYSDRSRVISRQRREIDHTDPFLHKQRAEEFAAPAILTLLNELFAAILRDVVVPTLLCLESRNDYVAAVALGSLFCYVFGPIV